MANKAPYYYSEILQSSMSGEAETNERPTAGGVAESTLEKNFGFENPLLSIEPDVSTPDTTLDKAKHFQKKKKKKKKNDEPPLYRRSQSLFHNGCANENLSKCNIMENQFGTSKPPPSKKEKHKRRNSEPNIYEEINDSNKVYDDNISYYTGSIVGSLFNRRKPYCPYSLDSAGDGSGGSSMQQEVAKVEQMHSIILENLNLDVEAMLMPKDGSCTEELSQVCPTSSTAEYASYADAKIYGTATKSKVKPSLSATGGRPMNEYILQQSDFTPGSHDAKHKSSQSLTGSAEPLYMLYDDSHRGKVGPEDNIYEEVDLEGLGWEIPISDSEGHTFSKGKPRSSKKSGKKDSEGLASGFTRWFSTRKKEYELDRCVSRLNKRYTVVVGEEGYVDVKIPKKQRSPLALPPAPAGLSQEKLHRRFIINNLVDSENSYVITLQRLIRDYKHPLEDSNPPILCPKKISTMFYRVEQILQCHNIFGIRLNQCIKKWDEEEKIGDVFAASFSMRMVLDIYSDFINNFSLAMETAKQASKQKPAFADFLKVKQLTSSDRLSFFGLMVKPVQRFPQFILLLQDLLKHTPPGHHDRIALQVALSQLECLTETLNERKREAEQHFAVRELVRHLGGKFTVKAFSEKGHYLLRQDEVLELRLDSTGLLVKSKPRRIFLLNDLLVCITVTTKSRSSGGSCSEHYSLKWAAALIDVEVQESVAPATSNLLASSSRSSSNGETSSLGKGEAQGLYGELKNLVHDLEVLSRISSLVTSLKKPHPELTVQTIQKISEEIQEQIREKNEEITLIDSCCLRVALPLKSRSSSKEVVYLQFRSPAVKRDWSTDVRLARLALDVNNNPAWDSVSSEYDHFRGGTLPHKRLPSSKQPLFVKALPVYVSPSCASEVKCGCYYESGSRKYIWLCSSDGVNSHLVTLELHPTYLQESGSFHLPELRVLALEPIPSSSLVCLGMDSRKVLVVDGASPGQWNEVDSAVVPAAVTQIRHHCDQVAVGLASGVLVLFHPLLASDSSWKLGEPLLVPLDEGHPVSCLLPVGPALYCACGPKVWVVEPRTGHILKSYVVEGSPSSGSTEDEISVTHLAHSGSGLWVAIKNCSSIFLYHTETFQLLQDINIATHVTHCLGGAVMVRDGEHFPSRIWVSALTAVRGLLWVGTNVGALVTIPLPRLEGVPIVAGGRVATATHRHCGPVTLLLGLHTQPISYASTAGGSSTAPPQEVSRPVHKQRSDPVLPHPTPRRATSLSPYKGSEVHESGAKTLPRSMTFYPPLLTPPIADVYGLYADLMNVRDYDDDTDRLYERLNHSDPELHNGNKLPGSLNGARPRSWDLSAMAVSEDSDSTAASEPALPSSSAVTATMDAAPLSQATNTSVPSNPPRTTLLVSGGCGYVNSRAPSLPTCNATVILWETKT